MNTTVQGIDVFLEDITPFFYQRRITYVDVGAFNGQVFERILESGLTVREAHLIEPNARALNRAKARVAKFAGNSIDYHPIALGDRVGRVRMHAAKAMTRVVSEVDVDAELPTEDTGHFDVDCSTLDLLSESFSEKRISILKIDVEGSELRVLEGAGRLLAEQRADCIYIEAGMSPEGSQQCYYRDIEDALHVHGYRVFRIYEQQNQWIEDSPLLRRVNIAFFSRSFAESNPYRLTRELAHARGEIESLAARATEAEAAAREAVNEQARIAAELRSSVTELARVSHEEQALKAAAAAQAEERHRYRQVEERLTGELVQARSELEQINERMTAEAAALRAQSDAVQTLEHRLLSLREENGSLAAQATAAGLAARQALQAALAARAEDQQRHTRAQEQGAEELLRVRSELEQARQTSANEAAALRAALHEAQTLRHQMASLRTENARAVARAAAAEAAAQDAQKDKVQLQAERRSAAAQLLQVTQERQGFQAAVATQVEDQQRYRKTVGRVFDLLRDQIQREEAALKQAAKARHKLESLRNRPAYRAGKAVYNARLSPGKWLGLPVTVWRALRSEVDTVAPTTANTTAAFKLLAGKETLTLPLSRAPRTAILEAGDEARTIYCRAYSSKGGLAATVHLEISAASARGDDLIHLAAIGGSAPGAAARQGQTLRVHVRLAADRDTPLVEFAAPNARINIAVTSTYGDFAVLVLSRSGSPAAVPKHSQAVLPTPDVAVASAAPAAAAETSQDSVAASVDAERARVKDLGAKLWGYPQDALPELEKVRDDEQASRSSREWAAWSIARWNYVNEDHRSALANVEAAQRFVDKPQHRLRLLKAQSLIATGQPDAAAKLIAPGLKMQSKPDYALLQSTVLRLQALQAGKSLREAESLQLAALNKLLEAAALTPIELRDPKQPLSLANLRGRPVAGPAEQRLKVSVVMATYNSAASIAWVLASLLEQTWRNIEIIVVDDVSADNTVDIVSQIAAVDARVRLLRNRENAGAYRSRNAGAREASGDLITVHDSDDWSHPQKIECQVAALAAQPTCVAAVSHWVRVSEQLEIIGSWIPKGTLYDVNFSSLMFRRDLLDAIGYWDDVLISADAEFYARIQTVYGKEAIVKLPQAQLLAFSLTRPDSLTRSKATHLSTLLYGLRRNYRDAYTRWHADLRLEDLPFNSTPARRPFVVPVGNRTERKAQHQYDIVVISDFAMRGGAFVSTLNYVMAAALSGRRVAIFHWRKYSLSASTPMQPRMLEAALAHGIDILSPTDAVSCDVVLFGYPAILAHQVDPFPKIQTRQLLVIVNQFANRLVTGEDPQYDPAEAQQRLQALFGVAAVWIPISAWVKRLMTADPRYPAPYEHPWSPMIDVDAWCQRPPQWRGGERKRPVVGRHGRDSYTKWPSTKEALAQAYGVGQAWDVRFLGGAVHAIGMLGAQPENWQVIEFDGLSAQEFLDDLDFYIHYPHEQYIEEFGRAVMEAMARGIPVILPPQFKETFGDAAVYAQPAEVAGVIAALWSSEANYMQTARVAREFVLRHCDIKQFDRRLALIAGSPPPAQDQVAASLAPHTQEARLATNTLD